MGKRTLADSYADFEDMHRKFNAWEIKRTPSDRSTFYSVQCLKAKDVFIQRNEEYKSAFEGMGVLGSAVELIGLAGRLLAMVIWRPDNGKGAKDKVYDIMLDIHNFANIGMQMIEEDNWNGT